ncbi:MAG TPA: hypothetical protein VJN88_06765 [Ktedonobacterales bacterium]|nr:hypothetical protein [Ktedonobacterales bacterium]
MRNKKRILVLGLSSIAVFSMVAASALFLTSGGAKAASRSNANAGTGISPQQVMSSAHAHHLGGVISAQATTVRGAQTNSSASAPPFDGTPPLLFHGSAGAASCSFTPCDNGNVLMTESTGPLVVVPIYWDPSESISASYRDIINDYLGNVAKDSGHNNNVFSVSNEYYGNNGQIRYHIKLGDVITDTNPITSGCTVDSADTTGVYPDGSGYSACVDDAQLQAEIDNVTAANSLPHDLSHIYVVYLPKGVESCFNSGSTTSTAGGQACTINHQPTAAYCAYHSTDNNNAVYANMPYPTYHSPQSTVRFTCGSDARVAGFGQIESPNGNPDADVEISPTSHEIAESITDPDVQTGWYDSSGFENGDECAYIYGPTQGTAGALYNQVIHGGHYLTQEEFSNNLYIFSGGTSGCIQGTRANR